MVCGDGPLVKRLRRRPLTPETGVRFSHGSPILLTRYSEYAILRELSKESDNKIVGVICDEGTPVPIPNTVVKLIYADNTWLATAREDRSMPTQKRSEKIRSLRYSSIAQLVEHAAVNRRVVGSSPTWVARL